MFGMKGEVSDDEDYLLPIGKARVAREGDDVTHRRPLEELLARDGSRRGTRQAGRTRPTVIDPRTLRPFDIDAVVESVKKTNRLVIVDECQPFGGIASEVAFRIQQQCFDYLDAPIARVTAKDTPAPYAKNLIEAWMPTVDEAIAAVKRTLYMYAGQRPRTAASGLRLRQPVS